MEAAHHDRGKALSDWLLQRGLEGAQQEDLLQGYCEKLLDLGVPLARLHLAQRAFHPQFGGIGFDWVRDGTVSNEAYEHRDAPQQRWLDSPMYHLLQTDLAEMREPLGDPGYVSRFPFLNELKSRGLTDYFATGVMFEEGSAADPVDPNNTPEGMLISWASDTPEGFSDQDITLIRNILPILALALKSASNRRIAQDLLRVYLGRDAGARVLSGEIRRGSLREIRAVICYFDLTGFTRLAEQTPGDALIAMLNDYFGVAVTAIQQAGGNVLKFMGDGMLAMFAQDDMTDAAAAAMQAAARLNAEMRAANQRRAGAGLPVTEFTLALHAGDILYGNIGGENRLDFTVIGPAVNLTARLAGMHSALGQSVIISQAVAKAVPDTEHDIVPLGRYMLRGVSAPQELFTLYQPAG
ncbi:adenylate/guanylate cyclase domain-containing protein [Seohaeicola saemankumensis]|nr:adenylate/guanylate cyclase domain-containing protein [Seohaeicola saemankumensis]MCA0870739.1 adenylate/guanylate cyclase domain-containing protein [Seohaeicola saemankumensis]